MPTAVSAALLVGLAACGGAPDPAPGIAQRPGAPPAARSLDAALAGREPVAAADPGGLARQIIAGEQAVRDPASPPELVTAGGRTAQVAYRALADRPGWDGAVPAAVPAGLPTGYTATRPLAVREWPARPPR